MSDVRLRRVEKSDRQALIARNRDNRAFHFPWVEPFQDEPQFDAWFERFASDRHLGFVALCPVSGDFAGVLNLNEIVRGTFQSAYLGYYGYEKHCGRGLMTSALREVMRIAFNELGLHRLEANIQPANLRSIALVKRLGFSLEGYSPGYLRIGGEWRDHERWAIRNDQNHGH